MNQVNYYLELAGITLSSKESEQLEQEEQKIRETIALGERYNLITLLSNCGIERNQFYDCRFKETSSSAPYEII
jgi:hypothetical protein